MDRSMPLTGPHVTGDCSGAAKPATLHGMPARRKPRKVPLYFRVSPDAAERIKQFLADYAGKPLYIKPGEWAEAVLLRAVEDVERQFGFDLSEPPSGRIAGARTAAKSMHQRRVNAHQIIAPGQT